ncbi:MAG: hypothetical protein C4521_13495 [Actinobacteria bacterium]|nr:MAG: hypothetical protein C4521_13495 [Actinomycetota bacterium]
MKELREMPDGPERNMRDDERSWATILVVVLLVILVAIGLFFLLRATLFPPQQRIIEVPREQPQPQPQPQPEPEPEPQPEPTATPETPTP